MSSAVHELPFREAFLAGIPDSIATVLRALGQWMYDELAEQGMMDAPRDGETLLRRLRRDLEAVEVGLAEIVRTIDPGGDPGDRELIDAARLFEIEVRDLASRMEAVSEACQPVGSTAPGREVAS